MINRKKEVNHDRSEEFPVCARTWSSLSTR